MPADLYEVLEVAADADEGEIRRAYQKLARRLHPDVRPGDADAEQRFAQAARAFEILSDPELRRRYDRLREEGRAGAWAESWSRSDELVTPLAGGGFVRSSRRVEVRRERGPGREPGAGRRPAAQPPAPIEVTLELAEVVRGTTRSFPLQREVACAACGGGGRDGGEPCPRCGGRGAVVELERVRLRIPRGIEDGARLRVRGKGEPLGPGRQADLTLQVRVRPHPYFRRHGNDVHADLPVTLGEAILGAEVAVPTVDGPVRVKVPPGTSGGRVLRLRGRGIAPPGGDPGDHYCRLVIALPRRIDDAVRELLERLPEEDPRRDLPAEPL